MSSSDIDEAKRIWLDQYDPHNFLSAERDTAGDGFQAGWYARGDAIVRTGRELLRFLESRGNETADLDFDAIYADFKAALEDAEDES